MALMGSAWDWRPHCQRLWAHTGICPLAPPSRVPSGNTAHWGSPNVLTLASLCRGNFTEDAPREAHCLGCELLGTQHLVQISYRAGEDRSVEVRLRGKSKAAWLSGGCEDLMLALVNRKHFPPSLPPLDFLFRQQQCPGGQDPL